MANLPEVTNYDAGVYQIAITDPVAGYNPANGTPNAGNIGIANQAALNLANRTNWLYTNLNNILDGSVVPTGLATLLSPEFSGTPTTPTPPLGDDSLKLSNTAFVQSSISGVLNLSVAGGTNVSLSAVQAGNGTLNFTGALTANIAVIVPNMPGKWVVENNTTGAYTLTVKTAAGTGVAVSQGKVQSVFGDGTNVYLASNDFYNLQLTGTPTAPTPAQFDATTKLATTAFVQRAIGNYASQVQLSVSTILTAAEAGQLFQFTAGGITATLPAVASVPAGATYAFYSNSSSGCVVACSGSDGFGNGTTPTTRTLGAGDCLIVVAGGGIWNIAGGSAQLPYASVFGASIAGSGYQKLPSGLIIQWGSAVSNSSGVAALTLPIAFPHALLIAVANYLNAGTGTSATLPMATISSSSTASTLYAVAENTAGAIYGGVVYFIAIGY